MNVLGYILKLILGSNVQGSSVRVTYLALLAVGWVVGDRYGVPAPLEGIVDQAFVMAEDALGGVMPGAEETPPASE